MTEMSCDNLSKGDFSMSVDELAQIIRKHGFKNQKASADVAKPKEGEEAFEIGGTRYIITLPQLISHSQPEADIDFNPQSVNPYLAHAAKQPINDMYSERVNPAPLVPFVGEADSQDPDSLNDMYEERIRHLKKQRR